jgi:hypothetical protein
MSLWTPSLITTALWLDASDSSTLFDATSGGSLPGNGIGVARWEDKSGNGIHATQSISLSRPTRQTSAQNNLDTIQFDGSNDAFSFTSGLPTGSSARSVFVVAKQQNSSGFKSFLYYGNSASAGNRFGVRYNNNTLQIEASSSVLTTPGISSTTDFNVLYFQYNGGFFHDNANIFVNGVSLSLTRSGINLSLNTQENNRSIGARLEIPDLFLNGQIGEIIFLSGVVNDTTRQLSEGYLAHKWGLQSLLDNNHPHKQRPPSLRQRNNTFIGVAF